MPGKQNSRTGSVHRFSDFLVVCRDVGFVGWNGRHILRGPGRYYSIVILTEMQPSLTDLLFNRQNVFALVRLLKFVKNPRYGFEALGLRFAVADNVASHADDGRRIHSPAQFRPNRLVCSQTTLHSLAEQTSEVFLVFSICPIANLAVEVECPESVYFNFVR